MIFVVFNSASMKREKQENKGLDCMDVYNINTCRWVFEE
jgi:hypothetical protein